jgi:hypothetical protein
MINPRKSAILIAVLFIIATVASVLAAALIGPVFAEPDYLGAASLNANIVTMAAVSMLIAAASIVGIPVTLFPIIRQHSETLSLWFLIARFTEAILYAIGALFTLSLLSLAQEYAGSGTPNAAYFETFGAVIRATSDAAFNLGTVLIFSLSAIILGVIFYQTKLVPNWLSVWKIVGGVLLFVQGLLVLFELATPTLEATLFIPIAVNEMVLAVWLIVKGFSASALAGISEELA